MGQGGRGMCTAEAASEIERKKEPLQRGHRGGLVAELGGTQEPTWLDERVGSGRRGAKGGGF